jgi:hypothetical protein
VDCGLRIADCGLWSKGKGGRGSAKKSGVKAATGSGRQAAASSGGQRQGRVVCRSSRKRWWEYHV